MKPSTPIQRIRRQALALTRWQRLRQGFIIGCGLSILLLLLWGGDFFSSARLQLNNVYYLPKATEQTIMIVALDDASLAAYGRSPVEWDRSLYAELVNIVSAGGARVLAFDLIFPEETPQDATFAEAIQTARTNPDGPRIRTVFSAVGTTPLTNEARQITFTNSLTSNPLLLSVSDYQAYVNTFQDVDGVVRRQPSLVKVRDEMGYTFPLVTVMAYRSIPSIAFSQMLVPEDDRLLITPSLRDDQALRLDENGLWLQNFFGDTRTSSDEGGAAFPMVSFQAVLGGEVSPNVFEDKIVLVGSVQATGITDEYPVPIYQTGDRMAGVEIHANAIETLLQNIPLRPLDPRLHALMIPILTLSASLLYRQLRWYWMLGASLAAMLAFGIVAFWLFDSQQIVVDLLDGILIFSAPVIVVLGVDITTEINRRRRAEFLLESLLNVASQQLDNTKIAPLFARDIQRVIATSAGKLWLLDLNTDQLTLVEEWATQTDLPMPCSHLPNQIIQTRQTIIEGRCIALPILWQETVIGGILLELHSPPSQNDVAILSALAQQAAPFLQAAHLFSKIERQNNLLQAIQDYSPNSIILLDAHRRIESFNLISEKTFPTMATLPAKPIDALLETIDLPDHQYQYIQKAFEQHQAFREEIHLEEQVFYLDAVPLPISRKWVLVFNDVSSLAALNTLRTQMIRIASHDLKNPLSGVIGYAEMLLDDSQLGPVQQRFVAGIARAADNMQTIITDILDSEQARSGEVHYRSLPIQGIVQAVIEQHIGDMGRKNQTLTADIQDDLPTIYGDERLLSQALTNLVGNAVKYTPEGGTITVRLHQHAQMIRFEVQDSGYGIPAEAQEKLFTEFYRVRTPETANIQGTGLGLSLVKSIITDHKGLIWVESEYGTGSTFFVDIPIEEL